jgi:tRNA-uridine 2-sulfurtransferase
VKIAAALSGGVDSSVAAALLVADGHEVVGITLQQWPRDDADESARHGGCCSLSAVEDARRVAGLLGIPYYVWNLEREFGERVIVPFLAGYAAGRTPNPCLRCNAGVRFDLMLDRVRALGFDALATGHYARGLEGPEGPELHMGVDPAKDQSYMLYHLDSRRLRRLVFPLGELRKGRVRELAAELGLPVAAKPDSQEICFVPRGRTREFLAGRLRPAAGPAVDSTGVAVGSHRGAALYTVGQRTGLLELREPGPWYVLAVDAEANRLVVGRRQELAATEVELEEVSFIGGRPPAAALECEARLRYHAPPIPAVYAAGRLRLAEPFLGPAPGQAAVLYRGSRVLGGGIISGAC